ncbi:MAG: hypothetical protein EOO88_35855, partial [Pedobacter sp.]
MTRIAMAEQNPFARQSTQSHFRKHLWAYAVSFTTAILFCIVLYYQYERWKCEQASGNAVKADYDKAGALAQLVPGKLCNEENCFEAWLLQGGISEGSVKAVKIAISSRRNVRWLC